MRSLPMRRGLSRRSAINGATRRWSAPKPPAWTPKTLADPHISARVRIPMLPGRRSLNLSNAAAVAVYEAWRQQGFSGAI